MNAPDEEIVHARYVIGLDIGDGESALVRESTGHTPCAEVYRRKGSRSILTAYSRQADGKYLFGEDAFLADDPLELFRVNFKGSKQANEAMQFGKALLDEYFQEHPEVKKDCLIIVGHPAGWPGSVIAEYASYMDQLGAWVRLLPESQSALVHVRDLNVLAGGHHAALGDVLVVDIGSSTVGFTMVDEHMNLANIEVGGDLGCSEIDRDLAEWTKAELAKHKEFEEFTEAAATSGGGNLLRLVCRRVKEAKFSDDEQIVHDIPYNRKYACIIDVGHGWISAPQREIPDRIKEPGGWASRFKELITEVKEQLPRSPKTVIITGGGSRMPFTIEYCREVFPDATVCPGSDPFLSVARGLASAGRQQVRVLLFRRAIQDIVTSEEARSHIRTEIGNAFETIKNAIEKEMRSKHGRAWTDLIENPPTLEAKSGLEHSIDQYLVPRAQEVCGEYGVDKGHFSIGVTLPPSLFAPQIVKSIRRAEAVAGLAPDDAIGIIGLAAFNLAGSRFLGKMLNLSPPSAIASLAVSAIGVTEGLAVRRYLRRRSVGKVLAAELAEEAELLIDEILKTMDREMSDRAKAVEKFVK
jgi:hypothetical protein